MIDGHLSEGIVVEIVAVIQHRVEVLVNIVELLQGQTPVALPVMSSSTVNFEPHSLHLVDVEVTVVIFSAEGGHSLMSSLNLVIFQHVLARVGVQVPIS